ncbi:DNA-binding response regulator [Microbacterium sp. Ru50]|uniref:LuxR C-terminal-related transcriptional regulator n=1 Tax=Microbacterium sp. Ru50 TaxID=2080744 RepID=UPI000CDE4BF8|nr:response regulator transcription factor [Microbacterium sp. Ru50]POX67781.1 DNA-binding response regulator [Microbacterium sp. Ru50]
MLAVLVLADHDLVRRGVADLIDAATGLQVVAEAATARQAAARAEVTRPDVAIIGYRLADGDGPQVCRALRALDPHLQCIVLSAADDDTARTASAAAGAAAFLLEDVAAGELVEAVRRVGSGHPLSATLRPASPPTSPPEALPRRQREVLALVARGLSNRAIAIELGVAEKTVKNHLTGIMRTLGVTSRTQAALRAAQPEHE